MKLNLIFVYFKLDFLQAKQVVKIEIEIEKELSAKFNFANQRFQKSSVDGYGFRGAQFLNSRAINTGSRHKDKSRILLSLKGQ